MGLLWGGSSLGAALTLVLFAACAGTDTPPHADIQDKLETAYGDGASAGSAGSASMSAAGAAGSSSAGSAGAATGAGGTGSGAAGSASVGTAGSASVGTAGSGAVGNAGSSSGTAGAGSGGAALSFDADIWPIFSANCGPCHTTGNSGGQSIGSSDKAKALSDAKANQTDIIADIANGTMPLGSCMGPPDSEGCLTNADFQKIEAWFKAGAPE